MSYKKNRQLIITIYANLLYWENLSIYLVMIYYMLSYNVSKVEIIIELNQLIHPFWFDLQGKNREVMFCMFV